MDMIVSAQGNTIAKQEVFHAFQKYCDEMQLGKLSEQTVTRRLKQHVTGLTDSKKVIDGKRMGVWEGIDLRASNCPTSSDETIDTATVIFPNYNFSGNGKKLDTKSDSTWLDENREVKE